MTSSVKMPYTLQPMELPDVDQVSEIEREAFPTLWPPTSYTRELKNRQARYFVCIEDGVHIDIPKVPSPRSLFDMILRRRRGIQDPGTESRRHVVGFIGLWFLANEAHIVSVAVRHTYKRQGIGELLVLGSLEVASSSDQRLVTLEVRVSNDNARKLYAKYGFSEMGVRPRYYVDNDEDAIIMSTESLDSDKFQRRLTIALGEHSTRYGASRRIYV